MTEKSVRFKAVDDRFRENYVVDRSVKTEKGAPSVNCGDDLAVALLGLTLAECQSCAAENDIDHIRWAHLNPGMQRMNIGNALRHKLKKGEKISIFNNNVTQAAALRTKQLEKERTKATSQKAKKAKKSKTKKASAIPTKASEPPEDLIV